jgi:hypothetical protein
LKITQSIVYSGFPKNLSVTAPLKLGRAQTCGHELHISRLTLLFSLHEDSLMTLKLVPLVPLVPEQGSPPQHPILVEMNSENFSYIQGKFPVYGGDWQVGNQV